MSAPPTSATALADYDAAIALAMAFGPQRPARWDADWDVTTKFYEDLSMELVRATISGLLQNTDFRPDILQ